jgi:hypothetical protein
MGKDRQASMAEREPKPGMAVLPSARGSATSGGKDLPLVNYTQPVSLKHYPRIQRQPGLPRPSIPIGGWDTAV